MSQPFNLRFVGESVIRSIRREGEHLGFTTQRLVGHYKTQENQSRSKIESYKSFKKEQTFSLEQAIEAYISCPVVCGANYKDNIKFQARKRITDTLTLLNSHSLTLESDRTLEEEPKNKLRAKLDHLINYAREVKKQVEADQFQILEVVPVRGNEDAFPNDVDHRLVDARSGFLARVLPGHQQRVFEMRDQDQISSPKMAAEFVRALDELHYLTIPYQSINDKTTFAEECMSFFQVAGRSPNMLKHLRVVFANPQSEASKHFIKMLKFSSGTVRN